MHTDTHSMKVMTVVLTPMTVLQLLVDPDTLWSWLTTIKGVKRSDLDLSSVLMTRQGRNSVVLALDELSLQLSLQYK